MAVKHVETFKGDDIRLGILANSRRREYRQGTLSAERIADLNALPGWEWDPLEADYRRSLAALRQYAAREGHARVPQKHVETTNGEHIRLGAWTNHRRSGYAQGQLSAQRIADLEAMPGWEWDAWEADYQRSLAALRQYAAREGHTRVPQKHVETFNGDDLLG